MGLVSRGEEQPDLLLPLVGTHPTSLEMLAPQGKEFPTLEKNKGLCWLGSLSKVSPGSDRHHCWLRAGDGEGLGHPMQWAHLIKSLWLLPKTAPTLPGGFCHSHIL